MHVIRVQETFGFYVFNNKIIREYIKMFFFNFKYVLDICFFVAHFSCLIRENWC